jgi:hypothetical protein
MVIVDLGLRLAILGVLSRLRGWTAVEAVQLVSMRKVRRRLAAPVVVVPDVLRRIPRRPGARMLHQW